MGSTSSDQTCTDNEWAEMRDLLAAQGRSAVFLLTSDEPIDQADYSGFQTVVGTGGPIGDLYGLSKCDYIIGPPSTFSTWAAFYGQVPLSRLSRHLDKPMTFFAGSSELLGGHPSLDASLSPP